MQIIQLQINSEYSIGRIPESQTERINNCECLYIGNKNCESKGILTSKFIKELETIVIMLSVTLMLVAHKFEEKIE